MVQIWCKGVDIILRHRGRLTFLGWRFQAKSSRLGRHKIYGLLATKFAASPMVEDMLNM